jgi:hypothetical protein
MNNKEKLLEVIEQAPDSLIEKTLNFLLSNQGEDNQSIGAEILSILDQNPISSEDLENLPRDLASQHDHYLYGVPKREEIE